MIQKKVEERPWGRFEEFTHNLPSTVKLIFVKTGEALSLQTHTHRKEFWHVVSGNPEITVGDAVKNAKMADEFFIEENTAHRIAAPIDDVTILEIALGEFDENDIKRLDDKYGRAV